MRANGTKVKEMAMVYSQRETATILRDIGSTIKEKVKALISTATRINFLLASGLMTSLKQVSTQRLRTKMLTKAQRDHTSRIHMFCPQYLS